MPRPRFQIHLATGLVLVPVASLLLFLNIRNPYNPGWPYKLYELPVVLRERGSEPEVPNFFEHVELKPLLLNILIALAILTFTAVLSEFLIRRRKPATPPLAESAQ